MVRYGNPFLGRYLRYAVFLLVLGILLPIMLIPGQTLLGLASIAAALLITIGFDLAVYWFCKYKAASFTKQEVRSMVPALITALTGEATSLLRTPTYYSYRSCIKSPLFQSGKE
jgi:hypothetical protein